jgi:hypothetical protein
MSLQLNKLKRQEEVLAYYAKQLQATRNLVSSNSSPVSTLSPRATATTTKESLSDVPADTPVDTDASKEPVAAPLSSARTNRLARKERLCRTCVYELQSSLNAAIAYEEERAGSYSAYLAQLESQTEIAQTWGTANVDEINAQLIVDSNTRVSQLRAAQQEARDMHSVTDKLLSEWVGVRRQSTQLAHEMLQKYMAVI